MATVEFIEEANEKRRGRRRHVREVEDPLHFLLNFLSFLIISFPSLTHSLSLSLSLSLSPP